MKQVAWLSAAPLALMFGCTDPATAQERAAPASSVTGNVALVSDYMFRGLTQSWGHPAIQGGADLALANGFAAGFWGSSISERSYPGGSMELDVYASYGAAIDADWSWRGGIYGYIYPGGNLGHGQGYAARSFNTVEANLALSWRWLSLKYSQALSDYFAADREEGYRGDSRGTGYLQLDASLPLSTTWSLGLHAGHTHYSTRLATPLSSGASDPSYTDLGATLKYQFATHWSASAGLTWASNQDFYRHSASYLDASDSRDVGGGRGFVMLQGTF